MRQSPVGSPSRRSGCQTTTSRRSSTVRSNRLLPMVTTGSCSPGSRGSSAEVICSSGTPSVPWVTRPFFTTTKFSSSASEASRIGRWMLCPALRAASASPRRLSGSVRAIADSSPSASMSKPPREAACSTRPVTRRGQFFWLGQRQSLSPSRSGRMVVPQAGHCVGITKGRSLPSRRESTGPRISGITSPALRSTMVSPISTPLRSTSNWFSAQRGLLDRGAGDGHRFHDAEGGDAAGASHLHLDVQELGGDLFGRILEGGRPARGARGRAQGPLLREGVDLHDDAVDLVLDVVAVLAVVLDVVDLLREATTFMSGWFPGLQVAEMPLLLGRRGGSCCSACC